MIHELTVYKLGKLLSELTNDYKINLLVKRKLSGGFITITGEVGVDYFRKGQMIALNGSLQQRSYNDQNGNKRTVYEVVVENANFCGSKNESGSGDYTSQIPNEAPASFSNLNDGDFEEIAVDDGDYPF